MYEDEGYLYAYIAVGLLVIIGKISFVIWYCIVSKRRRRVRINKKEILKKAIFKLCYLFRREKKELSWPDKQIHNYKLHNKVCLHP